MKIFGGFTLKEKNGCTNQVLLKHEFIVLTTTKIQLLSFMSNFHVIHCSN